MHNKSEILNKLYDKECPICLDYILNNEHILSCNHKFHKKCILDWLQKNNICPTCNKQSEYIILIHPRKRVDSYNTFESNTNLNYNNQNNRINIKKYILISIIFIIVILFIYSII